MIEDNKDKLDGEMGLTGYVMFMRDEAVCCNIVSENSELTIGLVYRSTNINEENNTKIQKAIKEVSRGNVS